MITMHEDAMNKASAGITSLEEILRVSSGDLLGSSLFSVEWLGSVRA